MSENETPDVLPAWANQTLILLWLLLFGGRWLLPPMLQMAGVLSAPQLATLDETVLLKFYLVLLAVTCVVVALRAVRNVQPGTQPATPVSEGAPGSIQDGIVCIPEASANTSGNTPQPGRIEPGRIEPGRIEPGRIELDGRIDVAPAGGDETRD